MESLRHAGDNLIDIQRICENIATDISLNIHVVQGHTFSKHW